MRGLMIDMTSDEAEHRAQVAGDQFTQMVEKSNKRAFGVKVRQRVTRDLTQACARILFDRYHIVPGPTS